MTFSNLLKYYQFLDEFHSQRMLLKYSGIFRSERKPRSYQWLSIIKRELGLIPLLFLWSIKLVMNNLFYLSILSIFLVGCDSKPIDYSKRTRKSSYVRAGSTQTGRLSKSHERRGVSLSSRAYQNRLNSRSYNNRNKNRRKLRKGDQILNNHKLFRI